MSRWFSKSAKNVFQPQVPGAAQPFVLGCPYCGESVQGMRHAEGQRLICKSCRNLLFVLPRDVYPAPQPELSSQEPSFKKEPPTTEVEELLDENLIALLQDDGDLLDSLLMTDGDEVSPKTGEKKEPSSHPRTKESLAEVTMPSLAELRQRIRDARNPREVQIATAVPEKTRPLEELGETLGKAGREVGQDFVRFWTPFRILALAGLLIILLTAGWTWRQSELSEAKKIVRQESELGLAAVDQGDWTPAREHLQKAAAALDLLGRNDPEARTVRQYSRELQAQFRLCDLTLEELLDKARQELAARDPSSGQQKRLAAAYRGEWVLLEGSVEEVGEKDSRRPNYQLRLPIGPEGEAGETIVRVNFPVIRKLISSGEKKLLTLAGPIQDVERDSAGKWIVTLDPEQGFLWTHLDTYLATGLGFNPLRTRAAVSQELAAQAGAMEVPP